MVEEEMSLGDPRHVVREQDQFIPVNIPVRAGDLGWQEPALETEQIRQAIGVNDDHRDHDEALEKVLL
jgi:hypothetical protein